MTAKGCTWVWATTGLYCVLACPVLAWAFSEPAGASQKAADSPIVVQGDEQQQIDLDLQDGGLKPLVGVHNIQVFRACRSVPQMADQDGWTYAHHQDLACWRGRLYATWAMTPKDEDVPPYKVVYATSTDGFHWSAPTDFFPRGYAWATRFYFYRASNGRMLGCCAGKSADGTVSEAAKNILLVREITADHQLGEVFTLIAPIVGMPPSFETSHDPELVAACREAATNNLLLEQQDYGKFLGDRRMSWHQSTPKFEGFYPFGKAFCFYHRLDGQLVGLCKMGFVTLSEDEGQTWSQPVNPPTLIAGAGKIWGQRTADGRFALAYNPDRRKRHPLVLVHGEDGREFRDMRVVHGELPPLRYLGKYKDLGPQYIRGLAEWSNDGTLADQQAMWLLYSVHKEDLWISRIPLPIQPDATAFPSDDFATATPGSLVPGWNIYSPRWAPVSIVTDEGRSCLELRDADPSDYARAVRVFPAAAAVRVELRLRPGQTEGRLEIELCDAVGRRPIRLALAEGGKLQASDDTTTHDLGSYDAGRGLSLTLETDLAAGRYTVRVNDARPQTVTVAEPGVPQVERLSLRTGAWRGWADAPEVDRTPDEPLSNPAWFRLDHVAIESRD